MFQRATGVANWIRWQGSQIRPGAANTINLSQFARKIFSATSSNRVELADPGERELFWRFARTLRTICHYEYSEVLDRLRDDYYYFSPEVAGHAAADRAKSDSAYDDLIRSLDKVLKDANFEELPHED